MRIWARIRWGFGWPWRAFRLLTRRIDVLVVDGTHRDHRRGRKHQAFAEGTDHEGRIIYSVGGGGYNVAGQSSCGGQNGRVALDTMLRRIAPRRVAHEQARVQWGLLDYVRR